MKWIKHHTNASTSVKLSELLDHHGSKLYGDYWLLLEILGERFDGENTKILISMHDVKAKLRSKNDKNLEQTLRTLEEIKLLTMNVVNKFFEVDCPILFELQDKDSKYNRKRIVGRSFSAITEVDEEEDAEVDKIKKQSKNPKQAKGALEIFQHSKPFIELLKSVPQEAQMKWLEHYGKQHVEDEFAKAHIWLASNPERKFSSLGRFLGNWLIRSENKSSKPHNGTKKLGSRITPDNPTGNPYLQEAIDKGLTA